MDGVLGNGLTLLGYEWDALQIKNADGNDAVDIQSGQIKLGDTVWVKIDGSYVPSAYMPSGWIADDSSAFQGEAGSLDSVTVYGAISQAIEDSSLTASNGSGLYACNFVSFDSLSDQVIPLAKVAVRNIDQSALVAIGQTGADGSVQFNLDAGSYIAIGFSAGYIFESYDTLAITGASEDSLFAYWFDPGSPVDPALCRVYGYLFDVGGNPEEDAVITAGLPSGVDLSGTNIISPFTIESTSDSTGYFHIDLIPSADFNSVNIQYELTITRSNGTILRKKITVPDLSNWILSW